MTHDRKPSDWQEVTRFLETTMNLAMVVRRDISVTWPKYSMNLGQVRQGDERGHVRQHIAVRVDRDPACAGTVRLRDPLISAVADLVNRAEAYIVEASNKLEQERLYQRDTPRAPQAKHRVMREGKTARDRKRIGKGKRAQPDREHW